MIELLYSHLGLTILTFTTALVITYFSIPSVIHVSKVKHLFDIPGERASHTEAVPRLGGVAIFAGLLFATTLWIPFSSRVQFVLPTFILIFIVGVRDDLLPLPPFKKLIAQFIAAAILIFQADVRISSLYGLFGVHGIPYLVSVALSFFTIITLINAVNLIDGINGLSAGIGTIVCSTLGFWFFANEMYPQAMLAAGMVGALLGFLRYNWTPAKIFMGDTGSLILGLMCTILIVDFIEANNTKVIVMSVPAVAVAILIIPVFDTARVFTLRVMQGRSPFSADRGHLHHLLLDLGLSHLQASATLCLTNIGFIVLAFCLQSIGTLYLLLIVFGLAVGLTQILWTASRKRKAELEDGFVHNYGLSAEINSSIYANREEEVA